VAIKAIEKGNIIKSEDLTWKRPAHGVSPAELQQVVGTIANERIEEDTVIKWNMLS
jgi:N-acetylneuraminate synthase